MSLSNEMDIDKNSEVDKTSCDGTKKAAVQAELNRVNKLPTNSSYASHRIRVLNKVLQLMSIKRTSSQDEELELLFAGLSL
ncbi:hypothetical protein C5167_041452 [Papaver somniferum]|uniref:Uncharacterized protein n=1 Tax=Papaver somniferum TaxID=3469 RepID=A0A4Y7L834_PAPSO|nr:uncharacterized protein LOC113327683 [Papaver somniferum]XP_026430616.1 uncharacterized protein LOC113327683 [Papaver somniferum]KAI3844540.1 hypothetical protein MKX03_006925 [Papaver bracteatum]KAI3914124.1 hypothetical protein MKW92_047056 [Papaver armeniacum]RZC80501.1 hypothetical protein C5167_043091 [Papaver somniferum]RZC85270.1 hypothetical protein C5167_041452 [Papaver somniferum]